MTKEIATQADNSPEAIFRDKIAERIRSDIGDLMPDDMLKKVVADAVHAELYRDTKENHYSTPEPWVQEEVRKQVSEKISEYVGQQVEAHYEMLHERVKEEIIKCVPSVIASLVLEAVKGQTFAFQNMVETTLQRGY